MRTKFSSKELRKQQMETRAKSAPEAQMPPIKKKIKKVAKAAGMFLLALVASSGFAADTEMSYAYWQTFSSRAIMEFQQALTQAGRFGVPRYTTALLPTCNAANTGALAFDTTAGALKTCNGSSWVAAGGGSGCVPGGAAGQVLYSDGAGACSSEAAFAYTAGSNLLTVDNIDLAVGTRAAPSLLFGATTGLYESTVGTVLSARGGFGVWAIDDGAGNYQGVILDAAGSTIALVPQTAGTGADNMGVTIRSVATANVALDPGATGSTLLNQDSTGDNNTVEVTKTGDFKFYGTSGADVFETTFSAVDPTADTTIRLPALAAGTYDTLVADTNGFVARTGSGTQADGRTFAAGTGLSVANGDGVSGNPTYSADTATTPQFTSGTASPGATCNVGEVYLETDVLRACSCSATNTWTCNGKLRNHATDCTSLTDGLVNEMCFEADANTLYVCEPSAGNCDTAGEWTVVATGSGAPTDAKYIVAEANGSLSAEVAPSADDQVPVSDGTTAATWRTLPNCTDTGGNHLNYTQSSNSFSCGTTASVTNSVWMSVRGNSASSVLAQNIVYWLANDGPVPTTNSARYSLPVPAACTLTAVYWSISVRGTLGTTGQTILHQVSKNESTDTTGVSFDYDAVTNTGSETGLSLGFSAGDTVDFKLTTPVTWTTAADGVRVNVTATFTVP